MLTAVVRPGPVYSFLQQVVVASPGAAGVVASGAVKPTKKLGVARLDAELKVIAVLSEPVDKFLLEDAGSLTTWVGTELGEAVKDAIEAQILTGSGSGGNFQGLATLAARRRRRSPRTRSSPCSRASRSSKRSASPRRSWPSARLTGWRSRRQGRPGVLRRGRPHRLHRPHPVGVPVALVGGLAAGSGYVVGSESIALSTDSNGIRAEWGTPGDAFTRNQLVARVEGRFNLDAMRPHGVVKLALTGRDLNLVRKRHRCGSII
ncbi:phage major capsid protein [Oerskovia sp. M15]